MATESEPSIKRKQHVSLNEDNFITVEQLEENGFYFNPNRNNNNNNGNNCELLLSDKEYSSKYCYNNLGELNENNLFVSPNKIINFELNRLQKIMNKNNKIEIFDFKLLMNIIGNNLLSDIMRIIDKKYVKQICSNQFNRIFYCVLNEKSINKKWKKIKHDQREAKEENERIQKQIKDMSFESAQMFIKQQKKQNENTQIKQKRKKFKIKKDISEWKYKYVQSAIKLKQKRINNNNWEYNNILKLNDNINNKYPNYKILKCIRNKMRIKNSYNVFIGENNICFCECTKYKHILRRLYSLKNLKPKDIQIEQPKLPFCKHILSVKIALILKQFEVINVSEEVWCQRVIEHISNNIPKSIN